MSKRPAGWPHDAILKGLRTTAQVHQELAGSEAHQQLIAKAAEVMTAAMEAGRKILWCGNGGSATQSQHMAAEFVGRFSRERRSLPSISLTENMGSITAIANDYSYDVVFARQLEGLAQPGDVLIGLSTSGNSRNVLAALQKAKVLKLPTIGFTGGSGGKMRELCDICIIVPTSETARIQEAHLTIGHLLCGLVEEALFAPSSTTGCAS